MLSKDLSCDRYNTYITPVQNIKVKSRKINFYTESFQSFSFIAK